MDFSRRRWRFLLVAAAFGASGYCAYRMYNLSAMVDKRRKIAKLLGAFASLAKAVSASAETVAIVSEDLNNFLRSDSNEIPPPLRQISKIVTSDEVSSSMSKISEALTAGIIRGIAASESKSRDGNEISFPEQLLEKLFSESGTGFASIVVGSLAKNTVMAFFEENQIYASNSSPEWLNLIQNENFRQLIGHCIQLFVSTAIAVYLDKTMHINTYDDLFSSLTKLEHESKVRNLLVSLCSGATETLVKTSHQVLCSPPLQSSSSWTGREKEIEPESSISSINGWMEMVSSALAVPSNRSLVLDLTGRVASETVRSSLEFFLSKFLEVLCSGARIIREEIVERVAAKSMAMFAIFVAVLLHACALLGFDLYPSRTNLCI